MYNVFSSETFRCKKRFFAKRLGSVTDYFKRLASKTKRFTHLAGGPTHYQYARRAREPAGRAGGEVGARGLRGAGGLRRLQQLLGRQVHVWSSACLELCTYRARENYRRTRYDR